MRDPQQQAAAMFQRVQTLVAQESLNKQLPEFHNTPLFRVPFFFAERTGLTAIAAPATAPATGLSGDAQAAIEGEFWRSAKEGRRIEGFQLYVEKYPNGSYSSLARLEIDRLNREMSQQQVAATPLSNTNVAAAPVLIAESNSVRVVPASVSSPPFAAGRPPAPPENTLIASAAATQTPAASDSRGIEIKPANTVAPRPVDPAPSQPVLPQGSTTAPGADKIAAVSPEQRTTLPPIPTVAKVLSGLIPFPDGATYNGEYKETKDKLQILHGQGEFISPAFRYKGEFRENKKQGKGAYIWANGNRYEGDFVEDEPSGRGKFIFASGDQYEGEYAKGAFNGKGIFVAKNGDRTDGTFVNGQASGKAVYVFASGDKYEGEMAAGKMSGKGMFTTKGGDRWEATFINDRAHGKGVYYFPNGDRYEGDFTEGAMTGKGSYYYSTGYRSEGTYVNAQLSGEGKFYFNDGGWFEGVFEQGLKRAKGFSVSKDGTKRSATMVDGQVKLDGG
ncbi:MAG: hypothetical protein LH481_05105 [Burkholderiales bacterium]|nr:hypothetical protein [Burkholderiales bacterium]